MKKKCMSFSLPSTVFNNMQAGATTGLLEGRSHQIRCCLTVMHHLLPVLILPAILSSLPFSPSRRSLSSFPFSPPCHLLLPAVFTVSNPCIWLYIPAGFISGREKAGVVSPLCKTISAWLCLAWCNLLFTSGLMPLLLHTTTISCLCISTCALEVL